MRITDNAAGAEIARIAKVDGGTVSRWKTGKVRPSIESVIAIARNWSRPAVEALIAADYLLATDANEVVEIGRGVGDLTDDELIAEMQRRMKGLRHDLEAAETARASAEAQAQEALRRWDDPERWAPGTAQWTAQYPRVDPGKNAKNAE